MESGYTLTVSIDGAPFPAVVWTRDREPVTYTERVFVAGYDASLQFSPIANGDGGVYNVSLSNDYGGVVASSPATLTVTGKSTAPLGVAMTTTSHWWLLVATTSHQWLLAVIIAMS